MCGICGKISPQGVRPVEIDSMLQTITHRGPDDQGMYVDGSIGLGNRRLSIIDLPGDTSRFATKMKAYGSALTAKYIIIEICARSWNGEAIVSGPIATQR